MRNKFVLNYDVELYVYGCNLLESCVLDLYSYAMLHLGTIVKLV